MKKRILITDTAPLYPPLWGGPKRIWNIYSNLSKELFDIIYVGINFSLGKDTRYNYSKIRDNFREILCNFPLHYYLWHAFEKVIFKNTFLDLFLYLWMHTNWQFKYILNAQNANIIICSHPWSSLCIHKRNGQFFIYDAHNCEYLLMAYILGSHVLKSLVLKQVKKIEHDACKKSDMILVCSEEEKDSFINLYGINEDKIYIIPNGSRISPLPDTEEKDKAKIKLGNIAKKTIIFVGAYYKPNIEATDFIINKLATRLKDYTFFIVGSVKDAFKNKDIPENVRFSGRISEEELSLFLKAADLAINPVLTGSGINIKMLDYLAYGLPTITTQCGSRGLKAEHMEHLVIASLDKFPEFINKVLKDARLYDNLRLRGYKLVVDSYNWETISRKLENILIAKYFSRKSANYHQNEKL